MASDPTVNSRSQRSKRSRLQNKNTRCAKQKIKPNHNTKSNKKDGVKFPRSFATPVNFRPVKKKQNSGFNPEQQMIELVKVGLGLAFACTIAAILWTFLDAPKELVWILFLTISLWGLTYLVRIVHDPHQILKTSMGLLTVVVLIKVVALPPESVFEFLNKFFPSVSK